MRKSFSLIQNILFIYHFYLLVGCMKFETMQLSFFKALVQRKMLSYNASNESIFDGWWRIGLPRSYRFEEEEMVEMPYRVGRKEWTP